MNNMPELKIGVVAVSRDCFPESLSVNRRKALFPGEPVRKQEKSTDRRLHSKVRRGDRLRMSDLHRRK